MTAPRAVDRHAVEFQSDIERLQLEPAPLLLRLWPGLAAALIAGVLLLAAFLPVDVVVVAPGQLAAAEPPLLLRSGATARLDMVTVHPGDIVQPGQILAHLDPTLPEADLAALLTERESLRARIARFEAERDGSNLDTHTPAFVSEALALAESRREAQSRRAALQTEIAAAEKLIAAATADGAGLAEQLGIARDVEAMRETLVERQSGSQLAVLEARMTRLRAEADLRDHDSRLQQLHEQRARALSELEVFEASQTRTATEALADARPRLAIIDEEIAKARLLRQMSDLVAPRPGVVLSVAEGGAGSLITSGEPVVVLVPTDVPLIAEVGLRSVDVGRAVAGDPVHIKIDAFPWRQYGQMTGVLSEVGHASFSQEGSAEARHRARVNFDADSHLDALPPGAALLPGMTLSAEIHVGNRTLLATFFEPVLRGLSEALREP
ncbi:HlyD family type I secretion periplasmic adaptor subunit [Rhodobacter maris]|uniref:Membrane fusion protein (MFP) family protein n=1 Tax=Rhodobacter maris TaxID=446682 RepID=A0A285STU6_9RHOB|nr:HlyD family type I secretion periplasmic adaptor subunit [Rhodobacter maris]SOC11607.1 HlyD family secretion protein [Rhodobacter maris]